MEYVLAKAGKPGYEQYLNGESAAKTKNSVVRRKVDALFEMLSPQEQEEALELLETIVKQKRRRGEKTSSLGAKKS